MDPGGAGGGGHGLGVVSAVGLTQQMRLVDVFLLGPFLVWFALRARGVPEWARYTMLASGVLTAVYNGANYLAERTGP